MDSIVYNKNIDQKILNDMQIYVGENVVIGENVSISCGTKLIGETVIENNCVLGVNSVIENSFLKSGVEV